MSLEIILFNISLYNTGTLNFNSALAFSVGCNYKLHFPFENEILAKLYFILLKRPTRKGDLYLDLCLQNVRTCRELKHVKHSKVV